MQSEINRIEELKGKILGVTRFGSITDNLTRILLRKYGLETRSTCARWAARLKWPRHFKIARSPALSPRDMRVVPPSQPKILAQAGRSGHSLLDEYACGVARVCCKRNPDTAEKIVRAYSEGVAFMNQNKERALKIIAKYAHLTDPKQIEEHYRDSVAYLDRIPRAEPEAVQTILEFMGKKGVAGGNFSGQFDHRQTDARRIFRKLYKKS